MADVKRDDTRPVLHRDGTATYWSVYQQRWVRRASSVPVEELLAMGFALACRVSSHLDLHNFFVSVTSNKQEEK